MTDIVWSDILSVEVDQDHCKLVNILNIFNHAVVEKVAPEYRAAVLEGLIKCTVWHGSHEERLMLKYAYVEMQAHKLEHHERIKSARRLQQELPQANKAVAEDEFVFLKRWLTEHILTFAMRLGCCLSRVL